MDKIQSLLTRYDGVWNETLLWGWWGWDDCHCICTDKIHTWPVGYVYVQLQQCSGKLMMIGKELKKGPLQEELLKLGNEGYSDNSRCWTVWFFLGHKKMKMMNTEKHRTRTLWRKQVREDARKRAAKWHEYRSSHDRTDLVRFKVLLVASINTVYWYVI